MIDVKTKTSNRNPYYKLLSWSATILVGPIFWFGFISMAAVFIWKWA